MQIYLQAVSGNFQLTKQICLTTIEKWVLKSGKDHGSERRNEKVHTTFFHFPSKLASSLSSVDVAPVCKQIQIFQRKLNLVTHSVLRYRRHHHSVITHSRIICAYETQTKSLIPRTYAQDTYTLNNAVLYPVYSHVRNFA